MLPEDVRAIALLLPEVIEGAHRGNRDFRVGGRVFATLWAEDDRLVVRLTPVLQAEMVASDPDAFAPLDGAWGRRGSTSVDLNTASEDALRSALLWAWRTVAPPATVRRYVPA